VCPEDHVTGMIVDAGIWMCGAIVKELCQGFLGDLAVYSVIVGWQVCQVL